MVKRVDYWDIVTNGKKSVRTVDGRNYTGQACKYELNGYTFLRSYETIVAFFDRKGVFHKTWDDWSATTSQHCNRLLGHSFKKDMKVENLPTFRQVFGR